MILRRSEENLTEEEVAEKATDKPKINRNASISHSLPIE